MLEVLVAGTLFVAGTAGVLSSWSTVNVIVDQQRRSGEATVLAEDILDELRLQLRSGSLLTPGVTHQRFFTKARQTAPSLPTDGYAVAWTVTPLGELTFRRIDLTVSWRGVDRRPHALTFLSFRPG